MVTKTSFYYFMFMSSIISTSISIRCLITSFLSRFLLEMHKDHLIASISTTSNIFLYFCSPSFGQHHSVYIVFSSFVISWHHKMLFWLFRLYYVFFYFLRICYCIIEFNTEINAVVTRHNRPNLLYNKPLAALVFEIQVSSWI